MRLVSWNVNGIRACTRKGFRKWFKEAKPDVLCLQETRARPEQIEPQVYAPRGYHATWFDAQKPGYSGVATLSSTPHEVLREGLDGFDDEGRTLVTRHGDIVVINAYFPNGQRDHARVPYKLEYTRAILEYANDLRLDEVARGGMVVCGDFNTAHHAIDLKNATGNKKTTGFLPEERAALDEWEGAGWVDAFRAFHPGEPFRYTWWSNRPGCRERNVGWRIDYHWVSPELWPRVLSADILAGVYGSDHCPVQLTLQKRQ